MKGLLYNNTRVDTSNRLLSTGSKLDKRIIILNKKTSDKKIAEIVSTVFASTFDAKISIPKRKVAFRTSQFPFCPVLHLEEILNKDPEYEDYGSSFFFGAGTFFHEHIQKFLPYADLSDVDVIGCWKCDCGKIYGLEKPIKKPTEKWLKLYGTDHCHPEFLKYEEVSYNFHGLSGHQDMMIRINNPRKIYIGLEFKTTGKKYITDQHYQQYLPHFKHVIQIRTYCALLWLQYKIRAEYYAVIYFDRDKEFNQDKPHCALRLFEYSDSDLKEDIKKIVRSVKGYREVLKLMDRKVSIENLLKLKPCMSKNQYLNDMKKSFFDSDCPHLDKCFNSQKMTKYLKSIIPDGG